MSKKMLVLGGTVYLSKTVAETAARAGWEVTVAARGHSGEPPDGVEFVRVDRADPEGLAPLRGRAFDEVVDVARTAAPVGRAVRELAETAGHWTFVSTCSVYADVATPRQRAESAPLLEPSPEDSEDGSMERYGANKVACENLVRRGLGDRAFILRAGLIVGPGDPLDRFGYWPRRISEGGRVLAPGRPEDPVQYIDVRDAAAWILRAAEQGLAGAYDGKCPAMPRQEFLEEIARSVGGVPEFVWVSEEVLVEHGVRHWAGEESLGMWVPRDTHAGFMDRDVSASLEAGMRIRPLAETARDWMASTAADAPLLADLSREKEARVLEAWDAIRTSNT